MRLTPLELLLALWVALISTDRVDLLGGSAGFILTPYLALTPLLLVLVGVRAGLTRAGWNVPDGTRPYLLVLLALVAVLLASALLGLDPPMSLRRVLHFLAVTGGTLLMALVLLSRERWGAVLARGAEAGLAFTLLLTLLTGWAALASVHPLVRLGPATLDLHPATYGGLLPRLSGTVMDPNRAGLDILFFLFLLARWGTPGRRRQVWTSAGAIMALATLSRSFLLAALALGAAAWLSRERVRLHRSMALGGALALVTVAGLLLARPQMGEGVLHSVAPVAPRFSLQERSTRDHLRLLARGVEEGTASVRRAALGIGYGNAHLVLEDLFPGNKYGNFHSYYVTLLVECGVFALLLFLVIMVPPFVRGSPFMPMVAALAAFNLFYQAGNGPLQWVVLALSWLVASGVPEPPSHSGKA